MTKEELTRRWLEDIYTALVEAQHALEAGDMEDLEACLAGAGFSVCCALPDEFGEKAPPVWYQKGG
jgi:hypothetical protein